MTTIALHHILLKSPLLADDVLNELSLGARFEDMAAEHSACPSGKHEGNAGEHHLDDLPEPLIEAMAKYDGNSPWIGPVKTDYGYHILRPAGQVGETLRADAEQELSSSAHEQTMEDNSDIEAHAPGLAEAQAEKQDTQNDKDA